VGNLLKEKSIERNGDILAGSGCRFRMIKCGKWRGLADPKLVDRVGIEGLTVHLEETMIRGEVLKNGSKSHVSHTTLGGRDVVIKGYRHLGLLHSLRHTLQGSRAKRSWFTAHRLRRLAVPTPTALAYLDEYRRGLLWRSFFIYDYVAGSELYVVLNDPAVPGERKRRLIDRVMVVLKRLSEGGISHGDLKHSNMICTGDDVSFIDLDAMRPAFGPDFLKRYRLEKDRARFFRDLEPFR
jgi:tRNA A-37 threonylcarbamoyl transferase component Bud32